MPLKRDVRAADGVVQLNCGNRDVHVIIRQSIRYTALISLPEVACAACCRGTKVCMIRSLVIHFSNYIKCPLSPTLAPTVHACSVRATWYRWSEFAGLAKHVFFALQTTGDYSGRGANWNTPYEAYLYVKSCHAPSSYCTQ